MLVFGGLSEGGVPLGDTAMLRPTERGFCWEEMDVRPPPEPRSADPRRNGSLRAKLR